MTIMPWMTRPEPTDDELRTALCELNGAASDAYEALPNADLEWLVSEVGLLVDNLARMLLRPRNVPSRIAWHDRSSEITSEIRRVLAGEPW